MRDARLPTPDSRSGAPVLIVDGVSRQYGRRRVLRDVSFEGWAGEIIALLGPNGSGKTTLLGVLSTLAEPSRGSVIYRISDGRLGDASLPRANGRLGETSLPGDAVRRMLGIVGHEPQLYGELTARENLTCFARLSSVRDVHGAVQRALEHARLADRADDLVERFSRGMRQRLAFERLLLHDPSVLLLDEPFTGLDEESVARLIARLASLRARGVLCVLATHDLAVVDGLADRALVLRDGRLVPVTHEGPLAEGYRAALGSATVTAGQVRRLRPEEMATAGLVRRADTEASVSDIIRATRVLLVKDLRVEWRTREGLLTTACFALACVLVFSFGLVREGRPVPDAGPAVLWITLALSGTLAMVRTFERERAAGTLMAVLASPAPRPAVYLGKWLALMTLMLAVEIVLLPLVALFFQMPLYRRPVAVVGLLVAGTAGYAGIGTLFAAMLARTRTRDVLLPLVLYPMSVPIIIGGVRGTAAALADPYVPGLVGMWMSLLVCFDAVFVTLALWTFGVLMTEAAPRVAKER